MNDKVFFMGRNLQSVIKYLILILAELMLFRSTLKLDLKYIGKNICAFLRNFNLRLFHFYNRTLSPPNSFITEVPII